MSLYNVVLGDGKQWQRGQALFAVLASAADARVARFRDAWIERGEDGRPVIVIYTRTGGGNRECFCEANGRAHPHPDCYLAANETLAAHPLYLRDADDRFDPTYATFYFKVPDAYREALAGVAVDHIDMSARWQEAIARVGRGEVRPAETAMMDQIAAALSNPSPDAPRIIEI